MDLNVLKDYPYSKRYYLTHPWKWFKDIWLNLRGGFQRATKGYCYTDLWSMDDWFLSIFPKMLRELAEKHYAYPGVEPFETSEKWEAWLIKMAEQLEYCASDPDEENEYDEPFYKMCEERRYTSTSSDETITISYDYSNEESKELRDKYFERGKELTEARQKLLEETMTELGLHFRCLWD